MASALNSLKQDPKYVKCLELLKTILIPRQVYGIIVQEINLIFTRKYGYAIDYQLFGFKRLRNYVDHLLETDSHFYINDDRLYYDPNAISDYSDFSPDSSSNGDKFGSAMPPIKTDLPELAKAKKNENWALGPFDKWFSNDPQEYFCQKDEIFPMNLRRHLRKGDLLDLKILSIDSPNSIHVRITGPPGLTEAETSVSRIVERMTKFYHEFKEQAVLQLDNAHLEGWFVACPYKSQRTRKIQWRRGMICKRMNLTNYQVFLFDHGIYVIIEFSKLKKLYKPFGEMPQQSLEACLTGIQSQKYGAYGWSSKELSFFKKSINATRKSYMIGMVCHNPPFHPQLDPKLGLILVDPYKADLVKLRSSCLNFQMIKENLAVVHQDNPRLGQQFLDTWDYYDGVMREKLQVFNAKLQEKVEAKLESLENESTSLEDGKINEVTQFVASKDNLEKYVCKY